MSGLAGLGALAKIAGLGIFSGLKSVGGWLGRQKPATLLCMGVMLALAYLFVAAKIDARHWQKQSAQFERLYRAEQAAYAQTVANYRAAAEKARKDDAANKARVEAEQAAINERATHDYEARIAAARALADRLRHASGTTTANSSGGGSAPVSGSGASPGSAAQASGENGLSDDDALIATEQAIQLDELIKWVKRQSAVDNNGKSTAPPK